MNGLFTPSVKANASEVGLPSQEELERLAYVLDEDIWKEMDIGEKLDALQTVADMNRDFLGISHELNVASSNTRESVSGHYSDKSHLITIGLDSLLTDSAQDLVNTVSHEAYHAYQYRLVDQYENADEDSRLLLIYQDAAIYKEEFDQYIDGDDDFIGYYLQSCEMDARDYADTFTRNLLYVIELVRE